MPVKNVWEGGGARVIQSGLPHLQFPSLNGIFNL